MDASTVRLGNDTAPAPASVPYDALSGKKDAIASNLDGEILGIMVDAIYSAPTLVLPSGTADHWPLSKAENQELVKRIQHVLAMMPRAKKSRMMKLFEKFGPPLVLLFTVGMITVPRIQQTQEILKRQRGHAQSTSSDNGTNSADVADNGNATAASTRDHAGSVGNIGRARSNPLDNLETDFAV